MTISELIQKLEEIKTEYGDLPVIHPSPYRGMDVPVRGVLKDERHPYGEDEEIVYAMLR